MSNIRKYLTVTISQEAWDYAHEGEGRHGDVSHKVEDALLLHKKMKAAEQARKT